MNEIERAIDHIERGLSTLGVFKDTVLTILRAELSRQENAPLTIEEIISMNGKPVWCHSSHSTYSHPLDPFLI